MNRWRTAFFCEEASHFSFLKAVTLDFENIVCYAYC
ncbi:hypothetical protein SAMN04487887_10662 [Enterococcus casseliflavus]|nr:hypothetical protein SAMN04487887_10662 [Enterococcus casseliflavus]